MKVLTKSGKVDKLFENALIKLHQRADRDLFTTPPITIPSNLIKIKVWEPGLSVLGVIYWVDPSHLREVYRLEASYFWAFGRNLGYSIKINWGKDSTASVYHPELSFILGYDGIEDVKRESTTHTNEEVISDLMCEDAGRHPDSIVEK